MTRMALMLMYLITGCTFCLAQIKPVLGKSPDPGPNRVQVRFAVDKRPIACKTFSLTVSQAGKTLVSGRSSSGFHLPAGVEQPNSGELKILLRCGKQQWHFNNVPARALSRGWWWVGTDYPPFQSEFGGPKFELCKSIRYLLVEPTGEEGFDVFETVPRTREDSRKACEGDTTTQRE